jgi:nucleotide-binding universal stress UspA family protein
LTWINVAEPLRSIQVIGTRARDANNCGARQKTGGIATMAIRTVLSIIGADQSDEDVKAAVALCEASQAHLTLFVVALAAPPPIGDYAVYVSDSWYEEREEDTANLKKRTEAVKEAVSRSGISAEVNSAYVEMAYLNNAVGERAIYADLTLLGSELLTNKYMQEAVLDGALFHSRTPALLLPKGSKPTLTPKRILVAWDSSVEASRALSESLGILQAAEEIHVTMIDPDASESGSGAEPGADIATYLARHGLKIIVDRLPGSGRPTADVLKQHAVDMAADLIVMGAYGHSRLRERVFGGVTKSMLEAPILPLFMAR